MDTRPVILVILDGWGYREEQENNAIFAAKTPVFDEIWKKYPHTLLKASGEDVGLPDGQMGNSDIGHAIIGAGKILDTDYVRITKDARGNQFIKNSAFNHLFDHVRKYDSTLHILGLVSPGGAHSHSSHLYAFLEAAKKAGVHKIAIHAFSDGRDCPPQNSHLHLAELEKLLADLGIGKIATVTGRYYGMDRDKNWDRIDVAKNNIFHSKGRKFEGKASEAIKVLHSEDQTDEYLEPIVLIDEAGKSYQVEKNDGLFYFNFRYDRGRELSKKILEHKADMNLFYVTMTEYDPSLDAVVAFPSQTVETTLAEEISKAGLSQVHIAETEKFAHATFYLNGKNEPNHLEEHVLVETRKDIPTHDHAPEMKAVEITDKAIEYIAKKTPFIFINYANPDVVGHTGKSKAIVKAIEILDAQIARLVEVAKAHHSYLFITADHGNAELNVVPETGEPHTAHTTNPVPAILVADNLRNTKLRSEGGLVDLAPTMLDLLGLEQPKEMTGKSLLS